MASKNFFEGIKDINAARAMYRLLAKEFHPDLKPVEDRPHYNQVMQEINGQYHDLLKSFDGNEYRDSEGETRKYTYNPDLENNTIEVLRMLLALQLPERIKILLVGNWLWIEGIQRQDNDIRESVKACKVNGNGPFWQKRRGIFMFNPKPYTGWRGTPKDNESVKNYFGYAEINRSETGIA